MGLFRFVDFSPGLGQLYLFKTAIKLGNVVLEHEPHCYSWDYKIMAVTLSLLQCLQGH